MNGKKAGILRDLIYGKDVPTNAAGRTYMLVSTGRFNYHVIADRRRSEYQALKRRYNALSARERNKFINKLTTIRAPRPDVQQGVAS